MLPKVPSPCGEEIVEICPNLSYEEAVELLRSIEGKQKKEAIIKGVARKIRAELEEIGGWRRGEEFVMW